MVTKYFKLIETIFLYCAFILLIASISFQVKAQERETPAKETSLSLPSEKDGKSAFKVQAAKENTEAEPVYKVQQEVETSFIYTSKSKVKAQSGEVGFIESDTSYDYKLKLFDKIPMSFSLEHDYIGINNTTSVKLPPHLVGISLDIEAIFPFFNFRETYLGLGVTPSSFSDDWDFDSTLFRIPTRCFLIHNLNKQWTFIAGVSVTPDFKYDILPIGGVIYKPNDKLTFNILPDSPNITYLANDKTTLFMEGNINFDQEFKLANGDLKSAVLRYNKYSLGTGITYKLTKHIKSSISVGGVFNRDLRYRSNPALGKIKLDNGLYSEFQLNIEI